MKITETTLPGVIKIEPKVFGDDRGYFYESFQTQRYLDAGLPPFMQDNVSKSCKGVLRGLHYQREHTQGKLIWVLKGKIIDVAVDVRKGSPTFGQHEVFHLDESQPTQIYIPPGFAHGFCVLSDEAVFTYKCTDVYHSASEVSIAWNDPALNINWGIEEPILSDKDKNNSYTLGNIPEELLPAYMDLGS